MIQDGSGRSRVRHLQTDSAPADEVSPTLNRVISTGLLVGNLTPSGRTEAHRDGEAEHLGNDQRRRVLAVGVDNERAGQAFASL